MPKSLEQVRELAEKIRANFEKLRIAPEEVMLCSDYDETLKKSVVKNGEIVSELIEEGIELLTALHFAGVKVSITTHTRVPSTTKEKINRALAKYGLSEKNIPIVTRQELSDNQLKKDGLYDGKHVEDENVIQERGKHNTDLMAQVARKKLFKNEERPKHVIVMGDDDNDCSFAVNIKKENHDTNVIIVLVNLVRNELKDIKEKRQKEIEQQEKQKEEARQEKNKKGKSGFHSYLSHMRYAFASKKNESDMILERYERILGDGYEEDMKKVKNYALANEVPVIDCNNYGAVIKTLTEANVFIKPQLKPSTPSTSVEEMSSEKLQEIDPLYQGTSI